MQKTIVYVVDTKLEVDVSEDNMKPYKDESPPHEVQSIKLNAFSILGKYYFLDWCSNMTNCHLIQKHNFLMELWNLCITLTWKAGIMHAFE